MLKRDTPGTQWDTSLTGRFLEGRVAVIAGGGRGVGREAAIFLARAGAMVAIIARTESEIAETSERIRREGGRAYTFTADISDWSAIHKIGRQIETTLGAADIVIVNASVIEPIGDAWEVSPEAWARNVNVNLTGAYFAARAFLPLMVERNKGILIFVSSGAATHTAPGWGAYAAAKAGLEHFAHDLAAELSQREVQIRVHILYPGVVDTTMQEKIRRTTAETFPLVEKYRGYHEKGWLRPPEEPALALLWLAGPWALDLHDQAVSVDDAGIRRRLADNLGISMFKGRGE